MIYFSITLLLTFLFIPFSQNTNSNLIIILTNSYPTILNLQTQLLIYQTLSNLFNKFQKYKLRINQKNKLIHFYIYTLKNVNLDRIRQCISENAHSNDKIYI